jgi:hypothetical protein
MQFQHYERNIHENQLLEEVACNAIQTMHTGVTIYIEEEEKEINSSVLLLLVLRRKDVAQEFKLLNDAMMRQAYITNWTKSGSTVHNMICMYYFISSSISCCHRRERNFKLSFCLLWSVAYCLVARLKIIFVFLLCHRRVPLLLHENSHFRECRSNPFVTTTIVFELIILFQ